MAVVHCCGFECGQGLQYSGMGGNNQNHIPVMDASTWTIDTGTVAPGGGARSMKGTLTTAANRQLSMGLVQTGTSKTGVVRFKINFSVLPSAGSLIFWPDYGSTFGLRVSGGNLEMLAVTTAQSIVGPAVSTGVWYLIEMSWDVSANPWTLKFMVDGVEYGPLSVAQASPSASGGIIFGSKTTAINVTMFIDDVALSTTLADYPIGDGFVLGLSPTADGTHSFTANDFKYENATTFLTSASTVYTHVDDLINNTTDYITDAVSRASNTAYVEVGGFALPGSPAVASINAVTLVASFNSTAGQGNTSSFNLNDNGNISAIFTLLSTGNGGATLGVFSKTYATAPSSGTWTSGVIGTTKVRFGYSTDAAPVPNWHAVVLEVDCKPVTVATWTPQTTVVCM